MGNEFEWSVQMRHIYPCFKCAPLMHMIAEWRSENERWHRTHPITTLCGCSCGGYWGEATVAALPIPSEVLKASGVKESYFNVKNTLFIGTSLLLLMTSDIWRFLWVGALGLKTCTLKNALCCCRPQQPSVLISKWAALSLLAVEYDRNSPDMS